VERSRGSGFGLTTLSLQLTRSREQVGIEAESSFYSMTNDIEISHELLERPMPAPWRWWRRCCSAWTS